jgi:hypothetical protein
VRVGGAAVAFAVVGRPPCDALPTRPLAI